MRINMPTSGSLLATAIAYLTFWQTTSAAPLQTRDGLKVHLSVADGLLNSSSVDGRVMLMFAPAGVDPLDDWVSNCKRN